MSSPEREENKAFTFSGRLRYRFLEALAEFLKPFDATPSSDNAANTIKRYTLKVWKERPLHRARARSGLTDATPAWVPADAE